MTADCLAAQRSALLVILSALLPACMTDPRNAESARIVQRSLANEIAPVSVVRAAESPPDPRLIEREATWPRAAVGGLVVGAAIPWLVPPYNVEVNLILTPIFAVGTAAYAVIESSPDETQIPHEQLPGVESLLARVSFDRSFERALIAEVVALGNQRTGRVWQTIEPQEAAESGHDPRRVGLLVIVSVEKLGFSRDKGEDDLTFIVEGKTYVGDSLRMRRSLLGSWSHESASHSLAVWIDGDDGLFEMALKEAAEQIAGDVVNALEETMDYRVGG